MSEALDFGAFEQPGAGNVSELIQAGGDSGDLVPEECRQSWERRSDESSLAFYCFSVYRDIGPGRSLREVGRRTNRQYDWIQKWATKFDWVQRAEEWDSFVDQTTRQEHIKKIRDMRHRHANEAVLLQQKAIQRLKSMNAAELSPMDVVRFIVEATKIERTARGDGEAAMTLTVSSGGQEETPEMIQRILDDPEAIKFAHGLLKKHGQGA